MTPQFQPVFLPLQFNQVLEIVKQLGKVERQKLLVFLLSHRSENDDSVLTHFASENVLSKEWLTEKEDEAWQDL